MGDENHRRLELLLNAGEFPLELNARHRIKSAERFIHQKDRRIDRESSRHAHALTLTTRKLGRPARRVDLRRKTHEIEQRVHALTRPIGSPPLETRHEPDIFFDGHVRKQADILEHVADATSEPDAVPLARVTAFDPDRSRYRQQQTIDQLEDGGLAGAAPSHEHHDFAGADRQRESVEQRRAVRVAEFGLVETNGGVRIHREQDIICHEMDIKRFHIRHGQRVDLRRYDPADTGSLHDKEKAADKLNQGLERLVALQDRLYAQHRWAVLLIFQAMDAAGKDSAIKHVMSGLNPQGTQVFSFKRPSDEELDHDYLWRSAKALPERGRIGIFNRSYFEEVLVVRVHPEILEGQRLPSSLVTRRLWDERYEDINAFERHLDRNGTLIRKFFLHVSKEEQRRRLLERLDDPAKNWKFQTSDLQERDRWHDYMKAYEEALSKTSTKHAPWFIIPADHKWFMRLAIAEIVVDALEGLDLDFPKLSAAHRAELAAARKRLDAKS